MSQINIKKISNSKIKTQGITSWSVWAKEISSFPWYYSDKEIACIIEGEVKVTTESGEIVNFCKDGLVKFKSSLRCTWNIKKPLKKYYQFG